MWHKEKPSRTWRAYRGKDFTVEVVSWHRDDQWHWNVYAYVFDSHPRYSEASALMHSAPLHGGCTFDERVSKEPIQGIRYEFQRKTEHVKFGSDYSHYQDHYENCDPEYGIPPAVVWDANHLVAFLSGEDEDHVA